MTMLDQLRLHDLGLRDRVDTLLEAPAELLLPERLLLYALVRSFRPTRCLEIGSHFGGSTAIIGAALDDVGAGTLVCIDPNPLVPADLWETLAARATMIRGSSPNALLDARETAGGPFGFVFIDGDHTVDGVVRDVEGVLTVCEEGAYLVFHDSHYREVRKAIDDCIVRFSDRLVDCGMLSTTATEPIAAADGTTARWGGIRMLRRMSDQVRGSVR